jgi:hypothetical protein
MGSTGADNFSTVVCMELSIDQVEGLARVRQMAANGDLQRLFERASLSRWEIGLAVGISPVTVHGWLRGRHRPVGRPALALVELGPAASSHPGQHGASSVNATRLQEHAP